MTLSLRQIKYFRTRVVLAQIFVEKLKMEKFEEISIKDICAEAEISEATFFNYFPQKIDVIAYWLKGKLFKIFWTLNNLQKNMSFVSLIEKAFELFAGEIKHPYVFHEVISIFGPRNLQLDLINISLEEFKFIHPDCANIDKIPSFSLRQFFEEKISLAKKDNLISKEIDEKVLVQFLLTILKGVPLSTPANEFAHIARVYQKHLTLLWKIIQP